MSVSGEVIRGVFERCHRIFREQAHPGGTSIMCDLHDAFGGLSEAHHNCLGCNFADVTTWIDRYLEEFVHLEDAAEAFTFYLLRLYLFVERAYVIFEIVKLPEEYRARHFRVFQDVHKWANFFKHPKAFLLVHHPHHWFVDCPGFNSAAYSVCIDQKFVHEYYSADAKDKQHKLFSMLMNKTNVAVVYPDPVKLTEDFCGAMRKVVDLVQGNAVYKEVLSYKTTYENYFGKIASTLSADPTNGASPLSTIFTTSVSGGKPPYTWMMDYGDGATGGPIQGSLVTFIHTYSDDGTFRAKGVVKDILDQQCETELILKIGGGNPITFTSFGTIWTNSATSLTWNFDFDLPAKSLLIIDAAVKNGSPSSKHASCMLNGVPMSVDNWFYQPDGRNGISVFRFSLKISSSVFCPTVVFHSPCEHPAAQIELSGLYAQGLVNFSLDQFAKDSGTASTPVQSGNTGTTQVANELVLALIAFKADAGHGTDNFGEPIGGFNSVQSIIQPSTNKQTGGQMGLKTCAQIASATGQFKGGDDNSGGIGGDTWIVLTDTYS